MNRTAIIEYFTSSSKTLIFLAKQGLDAPLIFEARADGGRQSLTKEELLACVERLTIDFHGLPKGWDIGENLERFKRALSLPPAVNAGKRTKEVKQLNLNKPGFCYQLTYWERLSDALLPAELRAQLADCDLLCFMPHGPLHSLPFAALRWSDAEYLIERFGICYVHSASVLRYCQFKNRQRAGNLEYHSDSCLIAALAAADDAFPQEFEADGDTLASLFLERDVNSKVTRLIGAQPLDGVAPASKEMIKRQIGSHDVIHLACHGMFGALGSTHDPLDSRLLVSDGKTALSLVEAGQPSPAQLASYFLTAREVFNLQLHADLVTLRACSSGRVEVLTGDELIGLTRAFLYAGTPSLIVSLWDVNKRSSQQLLNQFYSLWLNRQQPMPKWQALQRAQQMMLKETEHQHPYHWAPFILVGDWL